MSNFDLFSYFGGDEGFASPAEPANNAENKQDKNHPVTTASSDEPVATTNATASADKTTTGADAYETGDENKVVHLASKRLKEQREREQPVDACEAEDAGGENELDDEEREALQEDEEPDAAVADKAELAGGQANTEVKSDEKTAKTDTKTEGKKEEKKPVFNATTFICYAGHNLSITKLFNSGEELEKLDLEAVRKRLEKDFPELSKQRTKMDFDEKKNLIVPMVTGGKKGAYFSQGLKGFFFRSKDLFEHKEPVNILAARDGYYEVRENAIGIFVSKAPVVEELEACRDGFKLSLPKIPEQLFAQLVSFFYDYAMHEVEVMGVFYWDTQEKRYVLDVPVQHVSKDSVDACYSPFPPHFIKVAEIHSHNTMGAFFSEIDDADETGTMLYGVVGRLEKSLNAITFNLCARAGISGRFIPLESNVIIEGIHPEHTFKAIYPVRYPLQWHERVHVKKKMGGIKND